MGAISLICCCHKCRYKTLEANVGSSYNRQVLVVGCTDTCWQLTEKPNCKL